MRGSPGEGTRAIPCVLSRYKNDQKVMGQLAEPSYHEELRESVLTAERALLYGLGFQLNIDHPHYFAIKVVAELARQGGPVGAFWADFSGKHVTGAHGNVTTLSVKLPSCFLVP